MDREWGNGQIMRKWKENEEINREWGNGKRMRKWRGNDSLSISSFSPHFLSISSLYFHFLFIFSFSLHSLAAIPSLYFHFLFIFSFSLHSLAARLPDCHSLWNSVSLCKHYDCKQDKQRKQFKQWGQFKQVVVACYLHLWCPRCVAATLNLYENKTNLYFNMHGS